MFYPLPHITAKDLPEQFTYPFHYQAHPLCIEAAQKLQEKLKAWQWDSCNQGKMFGVLIVEKTKGHYGYLWAYSGNITTHLDAQAFVPPIYNPLAADSFFPKGEAELKVLHTRLQAMEKEERKCALERALAKEQTAMTEALAMLKSKHQLAKAKRKTQRQANPSADLLQQLSLASQKEKIERKNTRREWEEKIATIQRKLQQKEDKIQELKNERKEKSKRLQQQLFDQYQLLNARKESKGLIDIFATFAQQMPPAAAGDCAGPRLLQYAYHQNLKPIAMAEFWWGKSPISIIRKSGHFYPACRSKCEPILSHMLQGLNVAQNPLLAQASPQKIKVIYEDEDLIVVNKPAGMLSVKGKTALKSLVEVLQEQAPRLETLFIVHRLDMATSGLLVLGKTEHSYKKLQAQFLKRSVKKRYEALLDGTLNADEGKIDLPLRVDVDNRPQQMVCYDYGKAALTIWRKLDEKDGKTRVAFYPQTGRTHQLRIHAAHPLGLNTPIVGDDLYGTRAERLHLHAAHLAFTHPSTGQEMHFKSEVEF